MRSNRASIAVAALSIVAIVAPRRALAQQPTARPIDAAQVLAAIDRGVAYLKREQLPRGHWNEMAGYDGGVTALCTLALLNSGVAGRRSRRSQSARLSSRPRARQDLHRLAANDGPLPPPSRRRTCCSSAATSAGWKRHQIKEGPRKGAWSYPGPGGDNSNAQFAVLALYDAQRVGAEVSRETWELAADYWRTHAERRRLLGLRARRRRHRQHDVRGHRRPGHLPRPRWNRATPRSRTAASSAAGRTRTTTRSTAPSTGSPSGSPSTAIRGPPAAASRVSTTISTAWSAPAGSPPAASSASTIGTAKAPSSWSASRIRSRTTGRAAGTPSAIRTSARRWRCCSCPRAAGRSSWPS